MANLTITGNFTGRAPLLTLGSVLLPVFLRVVDALVLPLLAVATAGEGVADTGDSALKQIHHRYLGLR